MYFIKYFKKLRKIILELKKEVQKVISRRVKLDENDLLYAMNSTNYITKS